jgi:hypothetical protein
VLLQTAERGLEQFAMNILAHLLVEGPRAPFYKTLIEPVRVHIF